MSQIGRVATYGEEEDEAIPSNKRHMKEQKVDHEVLAARKSKDWKDFVRTGSRIYGRDDKDQEKRVRRYLIVANALVSKDAENGLFGKPGKE